ncbi:hypothetical protein KBC99_00470 [Candidatus Saccharibacteria bacterium]|nr:hypothetical protein [Candidatus Saccharibacteria bacterium]
MTESDGEQYTPETGAKKPGLLDRLFGHHEEEMPAPDSTQYETDVTHPEEVTVEEAEHEVAAGETDIDALETDTTATLGRPVDGVAGPVVGATGEKPATKEEAVEAEEAPSEKMIGIPVMTQAEESGEAESFKDKEAESPVTSEESSEGELPIAAGDAESTPEAKEDSSEVSMTGASDAVKRLEVDLDASNDVKPEPENPDTSEESVITAATSDIQPETQADYSTPESNVPSMTIVEDTPFPAPPVEEVPTSEIVTDGKEQDTDGALSDAEKTLLDSADEASKTEGSGEVVMPTQVGENIARTSNKTAGMGWSDIAPTSSEDLHTRGFDETVSDGESQQPGTEKAAIIDGLGAKVKDMRKQIDELESEIERLRDAA